MFYKQIFLIAVLAAAGFLFVQNMPVSAQSSSCTGALIALLGDGCHYMYNDSASNAIYCNGAMTLSAKSGDTAVTQGCSGSTSGGGSASSSCSSVLTALLGAGCHYMYNDSAGNAVYCNGEMTISAKSGDTATTSGCSSSGSSSGGSSSSGCTSALISLLGDGCHYMYNDASGNAMYCNGAMTLSAKSGDTATTSGCSSSVTSSTSNTTSTTNTPPVITNVNIVDIRDTSATITWNTDKLSTSKIEYWIANAYASFKEDVALATYHAITLDGLQSGTIYTFNALSRDVNYYTGYAYNRTFTTAGLLQTTTTTTTTTTTSNCSSGYHYMSPSGSGSTEYCMSDTDGSICQPLGGGSTYLCPTAGTIQTTATTTQTTSTASCPSGYHYMYPYASGSAGYCMSDTNSTACQPLGGGATYTCPGVSPTTTSSCDSALATLLGSGCHYMYNDVLGNQVFCDSAMTQSAKKGDTAVTQGCSSGTPYPATTCDSALTTLLGTGCHYMYNDASGNQVFCNEAMTQSAKKGDTAVTQGCSSSTSNTSSSSCSASLTALLGTGCHYMYNDSASKPVFCNGAMTSSAKEDDTAVTQGCSSGTPYPATTCDSALTALLGTGCHYMYNDASGNQIFCNSAMTQSAKKGDAAVTQGCSSGVDANTFIVTSVNSVFETDGKVRVTVVFSRTVDQITLTDANIGLFRIADGVRVGGKISAYASGFEYLTFEPPVSGFAYELRIKKIVRDSAGKELSVEYISPPVSIAGVASKPFAVDPSRTFPAQNAIGVDTAARIRVAFTKAINPDSLKAQFFSLVNMAYPASFLSGTFSVFSDAFEFVPSAPLEPNAKYLYNIFTTIRDTADTPLPAPFIVSFSTASGTAVQGSEISGIVSDSAGNPVSRALVYFSRSDFSFSRQVETDASGVFSALLPVGTYRVEVFPPFGRGDLIRPDVLTVTVSVGTSEKLAIRFGAAIKTITGLVLFSGGNPVLDAEVGAYSSESGQQTRGVVDGKGRYTLVVDSGTWQVGIRPKDPDIALWSYAGAFPKISFSKDAIAETQVADFTVPVADGKLIVKAIDQNGNAIASAGIIADTVSSASSPAEIRIAPQFKQSDAAGTVTFFVRGGSYFVRGALPPESGFLNPDEQSITVYSGETRTVTLSFKKQNAGAAVFLSGVTRFENGTPTDAFVWAWSEKGGFANIRSDGSGVFRMQVTPAERWHIGAGKEISGIPYKVSEVIVAVETSGASVDLFLTKLQDAPLPPPATVSQPATERAIVQVQDGAKISIPPAAAAGSGTVQVEMKSTVEAPSQAAAKVVSTVYEVTIRDSGGTEITQLKDGAEIILPYRDDDLKKQGVTEDTIVPSFFDEKTGSWVKIDNYTVDKDKNIIIARVNHLTRFAIVAAADITPPSAPAGVFASALGNGKISIAWINPGRDFSHAKVYKSERAGTLGEVFAAEARGTNVADSAVRDSVFYYYTVRSVDPAGNESGNTNQAVVRAVGTSVALAQAKSAALQPGQVSTSALLKNLRQGSSGGDVRTMQSFLLKEGVYPQGLITGYFGSLTKQSVIRFQEKYASEILAPVGLAQGNGFVGPATRKKINALLGK